MATVRYLEFSVSGVRRARYVCSAMVGRGQSKIRPQATEARKPKVRFSSAMAEMIASDRRQYCVSISSNTSSAAVLFVRGPRHLVFRRPCASHLSHVGCAVGRQGKGSVVAVGWLWDTLRQWWAAVTVLLGGAVGGQDTHASAVRDDDGPDAALWVRLVF